MEEKVCLTWARSRQCKATTSSVQMLNHPGDSGLRALILSDHRGNNNLLALLTEGWGAATNQQTSFWSILQQLICALYMTKHEKTTQESWYIMVENVVRNSPFSQGAAIPNDFLIHTSSLGLIVARKCSGKCKHPLGNQISRRVVSITYNFFPSLHITNRPFAQVISMDERWSFNRGDHPGGQLNLGKKEIIQDPKFLLRIK